MPTLQVRDVPAAIYEKLKREAAKKHRSLAQQAIVTLARGLEADSSPRKKRIELIEKIRQQEAKDTLTDPVIRVREDRNR